MYKTEKGLPLCVIDNFAGRGNFFSYFTKLPRQEPIRCRGAKDTCADTIGAAIGAAHTGAAHTGAAHTGAEDTGADDTGADTPTWVLVERWPCNEPKESVMRELKKRGGEFISGDSLDPFFIDKTFSKDRGPTAVVTSPPWAKGVLPWVVSCEKCTEFCAILVSRSWLSDVPERLAIWERYVKQDRCAEIELKHIKLPPLQGYYFVWQLVVKDRKKRNARCRRAYWVNPITLEGVKRSVL